VSATVVEPATTHASLEAVPVPEHETIPAAAHEAPAAAGPTVSRAPETSPLEPK
jgi:hypothetical protein